MFFSFVLYAFTLPFISVIVVPTSSNNSLVMRNVSTYLGFHTRLQRFLPAEGPVSVYFAVSFPPDWPVPFLSRSVGLIWTMPMSVLSESLALAEERLRAPQRSLVAALNNPYVLGVIHVTRDVC